MLDSQCTLCGVAIPVDAVKLYFTFPEGSSFEFKTCHACTDMITSVEGLDYDTVYPEFAMFLKEHIRQ